MKTPAYPNVGRRSRRYKLAASQTFKEGAAVLLTAGELGEAGADPAVILGFAAHEAGADPDTGHCIVNLAIPGATFMMQGSSDPVAGDVGVAYGLAKDADGIWHVDKTDTVATRVRVEKVYIDKKLFEVSVLDANRQLD